MKGMYCSRRRGYLSLLFYAARGAWCCVWEGKEEGEKERPEVLGCEVKTKTNERMRMKKCSSSSSLFSTPSLLCVYGAQLDMSAGLFAPYPALLLGLTWILRVPFTTLSSFFPF